MPKAIATPQASPETSPAMPIRPEFARELATLISCGTEAINITTKEPFRCFKAIESVVQQEFNYPTIMWDSARGFTWTQQDPANPKRTRELKIAGDKYRDPFMALQILGDPDLYKTGDIRNAVFCFTDMHVEFGGVPLYRTTFRYLVQERLLSSSDWKRPIVFISPVVLDHPEIVHWMTPLEFKPPDEAEAASVVTFIDQSTRALNPSLKPPSGDLLSRVASSALGLLGHQIEDIAAEALVVNGEWNENILPLIEQRKADLIGQTQFLEYVPRTQLPKVGDIGGFNVFADFVRLQSQAYKPKAREVGLRPPKGVLLLGPAGTGKSQSAKIISQIIYEETGQIFPTYFLNYDALFGSLVGQTEENVRHALNLIDAQQGCVLVIDEMEKFLGGSKEGDSGVSLRASARLLNWMNERTMKPGDRTYIVGTMNSTAGLAPEYFRRFDGTFYTDLPTAETIVQILGIHLRKQNVDVSKIAGTKSGKPVQLTKADWDTLAEQMSGFVGSEIEDVVTTAVLAAWQAREDVVPTYDEIWDSIQNRRKNIISVTHAEQVEATRQFCRNHARNVYEPTQVDADVSPARRHRSVNISGRS